MTAVCSKCAKDKGLVLKDKVVGMWQGKCETCGIEQVLCAERDYKYPNQRPVTLMDIYLYEANMEKENDREAKDNT